MPWGRSRSVASQVVAAMRDGLAVFGPGGELILWNEAAVTITGWSFGEAAEVFPAEVAEGLVDLADGRWVDVRHIELERDQRAILFSDARHQVTLRDAYARLNDLVTTDSLTGLPNRVLADDRLRLSVNLAKRDGRSVALLYLDLDRFKLINDTLGHQVGDQLLTQVAGRLRSAVRESDTAARVGGDEFAIILHRLAHPEDAEMVASSIIDSMTRSFALGDKELYLSTSIGIAIFPDHGDDPDLLMQHADLAMYRAKADGGNDFCIYADVMSESTRERLSLATELHRGLERNELDVFYQPQVDIDTGRVVAAEALVRWRHPERGLIPPARFLEIAEEDGSIVDIDRIVLTTACNQVIEWDKVGLHLPLVSVNLAARTLLHSDVVSMVAEALASTRLAPNRLELEISEHVVADRAIEAERKLNDLKALGVELAIDDFGTGYSSLGHLKRFPVDTLKLDRSFVVEISEHPAKADIAVLRAVVTMAGDLGLRCVAEGVETVAQRKLLRFLQCHLVQGYLYSQPVTPVQLANQLRQPSYAV